MTNGLILFVLSGILFLVLTWSSVKESGKIGIARPSCVFFFGVLFRYGLGSLITGLTSQEGVLSGEYMQYVVTWRYNNDTSLIWLGYISGIVLVISLSNVARRVGIYAKESEVYSFWKKLEMNRKLLKSISYSVFVLLVFFGIEGLVKYWTGSADRGSMYAYWAAKTFSPVSAFIAVTRVKQIVYFLIPLVVTVSTKRISSLVIVLATLPLFSELLAGGRGAVLYPGVMLWIGYVLVTKARLRALAISLLMTVLLVVAVPYIAAYRDGALIQARDHHNLASRFMAFTNNVSMDRVVYRYKALGRELYACSDSFLFLEQNKSYRDAGFSDLDLDLLRNQLRPRWLSRDKTYEKFDGSRIAQTLMGVDVKGWYPCITTPGDLWRRGRWRAVILGGVVFGIVLVAMDRLWEGQLAQLPGVRSVFLVVLPLSYIQSGLYGTVKEVIWQIGWDLPKIIVFIYAFAYIMGQVRRKDGVDMDRKG